MTFLCLKQGRQDSKNRAAHPHQEFPGVPARLFVYFKCDSKIQADGFFQAWYGE